MEASAQISGRSDFGVGGAVVLPYTLTGCYTLNIDIENTS